MRPPACRRPDAARSTPALLPPAIVKLPPEALPPPPDVHSRQPAGARAPRGKQRLAATASLALPRGMAPCRCRARNGASAPHHNMRTLSGCGSTQNLGTNKNCVPGGSASVVKSGCQEW